MADFSINYKLCVFAMIFFTLIHSSLATGKYFCPSIHPSIHLSVNSSSVLFLDHLLTQGDKRRGCVNFAVKLPFQLISFCTVVFICLVLYNVV